MSQTLMLKARGLYTNVNELSEAPQGAMLIADNVVINKDNIVEPRRGLDRLLFKFAGIADRARNLMIYQDQILAHYGTNTLAYYDPDLNVQTGTLTSSSVIITGLSDTSLMNVGEGILGNLWINVTAVADVSGSLNNTYFLLNSANNETQYYAWFNVAGAGTDPSLASKTGVEVAISTNATASTVATAISTAVGALTDFDTTVLTDTVTIKYAASGPSDIVRNGPTGANPGFSYVDLGTGIQEDTTITAILSGTSVQMSDVALVNRTGSVLSFGGWRNYSGTYSEPDSDLGRIRGVSSNSNFYFVTSGGVKKLDAYYNNPTSAGGIKAINGSAVLSGSVGFMPDNTQVAYRIVWGIKDLNNNVIQGSPSERIVVVNSSGGTRDVSVTFYVPAEVTINHFYQIYRSGASASATDAPNDELNQVYEDNPTASEIANGLVTVIDNTPESLRNGPALYTNPSQETILQANEPPPFAKDIAVFRDSTFYGNTRVKQYLTVTNLAVGGTDGLNYTTQSATYVNSTSFTVVSATGLAAGQLITGASANIPANLRISTVVGTTITVTGGTLTSWGATITLGFHDEITIAGVTYTGSDLTRSTSTVTMTIASPGVITWTANGLTNGSPVKFSTTGALPTGIVAGTTYYVVNVATNTFQVSATVGGTAINTSGTQSGVHTAVANDQRFKVVTSGTPAQNITDTILNLVAAVNLSAANTTVYAFYESGENELPGEFLIQERAIGGSTFYVTASSHGTAFNPVLPTSGTTIASSNDAFLNGLYFSKTLKPEAVPTLNFLRIGSADKQIYRILPLRDALFILKEDGIFRLTGYTPATFRVDLLDNTTTLVAPETAVALNNQIYALCDQGVANISDTGVEIVSRNIENTLLKLLANDLDAVRRLSFGIAYETERQYIMFTIQNNSDQYPVQAFVFNNVTKAWTRWPLSKQCGLVNMKTSRLYLGDALSNNVNVERKSRDYTDYVDDPYTKVLMSSSDKTLFFSEVTGIAIGDLVYQDSSRATIVTDIDVSTNSITVKDTLTWISDNNVTFLTAIESTIEYIPETGKNPGILKQYREVSLFFKDVFFSALKVSFVSELSGNRETVDIAGFGVSSWGLFAWGDEPWGGVTRALAVRTWVPQDKQRCSQLIVRISHREGFSFYTLQGMSLIYNNGSERIRR